VINDDSKYTNRPSNFSTTYRSSFVRYWARFYFKQKKSSPNVKAC
jgi:hypothetical protein